MHIWPVKKPVSITDYWSSSSELTSVVFISGSFLQKLVIMTECRFWNRKESYSSLYVSIEGAKWVFIMSNHEQKRHAHLTKSNGIGHSHFLHYFSGTLSQLNFGGAVLPTSSGCHNGSSIMSIDKLKSPKIRVTVLLHLKTWFSMPGLLMNLPS